MLHLVGSYESAKTYLGVFWRVIMFGLLHRGSEWGAVTALILWGGREPRTCTSPIAVQLLIAVTPEWEVGTAEAVTCDHCAAKFPCIAMGLSLVIFTIGSCHWQLRDAPQCFAMSLNLNTHFSKRVQVNSICYCLMIGIKIEDSFQFAANLYW